MTKIKNVSIFPKAEEVGVFISGSAAAQNILYTCDELKNQKKEYKQLFSVYDNHENQESRDIEEGRGFPLSDYLKAAKIQDAEEIKTRSVDGFESIVTEMKSKRYYFPGLQNGSDKGRELREAFLSFYKNGEKVKFYPHPTVMFGQQGLEDKNKDYFAKGIKAIIAGGKDRAFWVKGDALRCSRYFSLDQIFELEERGKYLVHWAQIEQEDGELSTVPAVCISPWFWKEEIEKRTDEAPVAVSAKGNAVQLTGEKMCWLFFTDDSRKKIGFFDGIRILDEFVGFQVGAITDAVKNKEIRIPEKKAGPADFYIRIFSQKKEIARYDYTVEELIGAFGDIVCEEEFYYYNHNMNGGSGGNRLVTAHGWSLEKLLGFLPQIPDREFMESGALMFQVFTRDSYKEKIPLEGNELTAYRFLLAFEQDQRTETGMEKGDTSNWEDDEKQFMPIEGNTPFRIYCGKSSANPAVYKNVEGIVVEII